MVFYLGWARGIPRKNRVFFISADIYFLLCQEHPVRTGLSTVCKNLTILERTQLISLLCFVLSNLTIIYRVRLSSCSSWLWSTSWICGQVSSLASYFHCASFWLATIGSGLCYLASKLFFLKKILKFLFETFFSKKIFFLKIFFPKFFFETLSSKFFWNFFKFFLKKIFEK